MRVAWPDCREQANYSFAPSTTALVEAICKQPGRLVAFQLVRLSCSKHNSGCSSTAVRALTAAATPAPCLIIPRLGNSRRRYVDLRALPSCQSQCRQIKAFEASSAMDGLIITGSGALVHCERPSQMPWKPYRRLYACKKKASRESDGVACYPCSNQPSSSARTGFCHASRARARHTSMQVFGACARRFTFFKAKARFSTHTCTKRQRLQPKTKRI
ncbi:hypothetical protein J3F83DRAFT_626062 [Trichoderma novae-zelandiae]